MGVHTPLLKLETAVCYIKYKVSSTLRFHQQGSMGFQQLQQGAYNAVRSVQSPYFFFGLFFLVNGYLTDVAAELRR